MTLEISDKIGGALLLASAVPPRTGPGDRPFAPRLTSGGSMWDRGRLWLRTMVGGLVSSLVPSVSPRLIAHASRFTSSARLRSY